MKRDKIDNRRLIKVYVSEADWKWIELQADGNVSKWCRAKILGSHVVKAEELAYERGHEVIPKTIVLKRSKPVRAAVEPLKKSDYCQHGLAYCVTCNGGS